MTIHESALAYYKIPPCEVCGVDAPGDVYTLSSEGLDDLTLCESCRDRGWEAARDAGIMVQCRLSVLHQAATMIVDKGISQGLIDRLAAETDLLIAREWHLSHWADEILGVETTRLVASTDPVDIDTLNAELKGEAS